MSKGPQRSKADRHNNKAPEQKIGPRPHANSCGFCGKHQHEVPLLMKSTVTNNTICGFCAIAIVRETMKHQIHVSAAYKQTVMAHPEWFERDAETGAVSLIDPDIRMDDAVESVDAKDGH